MQNHHRKLVALAACLLPVALLLPLLRSAKGYSEAKPVPQEKAQAGNDHHGFAGSSSCAGRGCHGAVQPNAHGVGQNEFSTWGRQDPHARAFEVLKSARAQLMAENLAPLNGGKTIKAHEDPKCLVCHSTPAFAVGDTPEMREHQSRGISCETCHGAAAKDGKGWLSAHTEKTWEKKPTAEKEQAGMKVLSEPQRLSAACVGCHVGSATQDLNHDLMAAGHPRLVFEASAYLANLPRH